MNQQDGQVVSIVDDDESLRRSLGNLFSSVGFRVETFATARRWGVYFRVVKEGEVQEGDVLEPIHRDPEAIPVYDIARLYVFDRGDAAAMERLSAHPRLDPSWKEHFVERLASRAARTGP